jgi:hypothetical protein
MRARNYSLRNTAEAMILDGLSATWRLPSRNLRHSMLNAEFQPNQLNLALRG